uniref:NADH dehydrogenase subunit 6 n=1 Tax=Ozobranchus jantseanus TaxID=1955321 RepID=A0A343D0M7_9ANNE|nr:NADH dehydrogenase subunit 6 [Ozobranchus jantseanus]ARR75366.1 NADH dehydrogenase subunit 6 [Ozobranchus jantseanus]
MMMMSLILSLSLIITALTLSSPILMAFNIMLTALSLVVNVSFMASSWYSMMIFLIYIGAMLVMFAYFVAITPNQGIKSKTYIFTLLVTYVTIYLVSNMMINDSTMMEPLTINTNFDATEMYNINFMPMFIMLILVLLFMMLIVVKLVYTSKGPLRPFM